MAPRSVLWPLLLAATAAALTTTSRPPPALRGDIGPGRAGVDAALECGIRALALDYARFLQPQADNSLVFDALRLRADCNATYQGEGRRPHPGAAPPRTALQPGVIVFYADAVHGDDSSAGTQAAPFRTITHGLQATRGVTPGAPAQLVLRAGTYELAAPVVLTPADSGLTLSAFPGEQPVLSGGAALAGLEWQRIAPAPQGGMSGPFEGVSVVSNIPGLTPGGNISGVVQFGGSFAAVGGCATACAAAGACSSYTWHDASVTGGWAQQCFFRIDGTYEPTSPWPDHFSGAKVAGTDASVWRAALPPGYPRFDNLFSAARNRRLTRAKSPNGNPETTIDGFAGGAKAWAPPHSYPKPTDINIPSPSRSDDPFFATYQYGLGGTCTQFEPAGGFWCSTNPPAGSQYNVPSGVTLPPGLLGTNWSGVGPSTIFHAFHGDRWADWKFQVRGEAGARARESALASRESRCALPSPQRMRGNTLSAPPAPPPPPPPPPGSRWTRRMKRRGRSSGATAASKMHEAGAQAIPSSWRACCPSLTTMMSGFWTSLQGSCTSCLTTALQHPRPPRPSSRRASTHCCGCRAPPRRLSWASRSVA